MAKTSIEPAVAFTPATLSDYSNGGIVSQQLTKSEAGNVTLFAFDEGQGLSEHSAPFDALVHVIDGEAEVIIGGQLNTVVAGDMILMPADIPHSLNAPKPFKMILTMIKG